MKILVVSGFLGAGKTTFITMLAKKTGRDFVIYENEYGQKDIDARQLKAETDLSVWESVENCICCTGKQDFASSVLAISGALNPEYLVVEPTGVANLSSVLENINQVAYEHIESLPALVIVDRNAWENERRDYGEIFCDQVASASTILISKVAPGDSISPDSGIIRELRRLNARATIIACPWDELPKRWWERVLEGTVAEDDFGVVSSGDALASLDEPREPASSTDSAPQTVSFEHASLPSPLHLVAFLQALTAGVFGKVVRAKGCVRCGETLMRFDVVDTLFSVTESEIEAPATAVFIGRDIYRAGLREVLHPELWGLSARAEELEDERDRHHHEHHDHDHDHEHHHGCGGKDDHTC